MNWIKKLLGTGTTEDKHHASREEQMLEKLESSIAHCNNEIKKAGEENEQIKKWTLEAISQVFQVPNRFWYDELERYNEIKALDENRTIDGKVIRKCDEVVSGYLEQIRLRNARVLLYQTLIEKYSGTKQKMEMIKKRSDEESVSREKLLALEKHSQRLDQLRNSPENLNDHLDGSNQLELLKLEAKEVIEEFEISEEVKISLEEINRQFRKGIYGPGAQSAIDEIEKLTDKIKKQE